MISFTSCSFCSYVLEKFLRSEVLCCLTGRIYSKNPLTLWSKLLMTWGKSAVPSSPLMLFSLVGLSSKIEDDGESIWLLGDSLSPLVICDCLRFRGVSWVTFLTLRTV